MVSQDVGSTLAVSPEDATDRIMEYQRREYAFLSQTARREREMKGLRRKAGEAAHSFRDMQKDSLEDALVDPAVNLEIALLRQRLEEKDKELVRLKEESQNSSFQPNSIQGKKLLNKCTHLLEENSELGRQLAEEQMQNLSIQMQVERKKRQQLKLRISELDRHAEQIDGENERMQTKIAELGKGLKAAKAEIEQLRKEIDNYNEPGGGTKRKKDGDEAPTGAEMHAPQTVSVPPPAIQPVHGAADGEPKKKKKKKDRKEL